MDIQELAKRTIEENNGVAKSLDFISKGLSAQEVVALCDKGYLERIKHGYYCLANDPNLLEEKIISKLIPTGIVCLESALFHYGYTDFTPRKWSIAVPRNISRKGLEIDSLPLKWVYVQDDLYSIGKINANFNGVSLPVYDRERTICDCFKYRTRLDNEIFNKAVNAYAKDNKKNLRNLSIYAKKLRVYKKVTEIMEVLMNV